MSKTSKCFDMYMVRDGFLIEHASQFRRGGLSRPVFCACGIVGAAFCIMGGIALGLRQKHLRWQDQDKLIILLGSVSMGMGFICIILSLFLSFHFASLEPPDYDGRRASRQSGGEGRNNDERVELSNIVH